LMLRSVSGTHKCYSVGSDTGNLMVHRRVWIPDQAEVIPRMHSHDGLVRSIVTNQSALLEKITRITTDSEIDVAVGVRS